MFRSPWFDKALGLTRSPKNHRRAPQRRRIRPALEALEDRLVLSGGNSVQQMLVDPPAPAAGNVAASQALTSDANASPMIAKTPVTLKVEDANAEYLGTAAVTIVPTYGNGVFVPQGTIQIQLKDVTTGVSSPIVSGTIGANNVKNGYIKQNISVPASMNAGDTVKIYVTYIDLKGKFASK